MPTSVVDETFRNEVMASKIPVIVKFEASWCAPCRAMTPILDELAVEFEGRVKILSADVEACSSFAQAYGVRQLPTLLAFEKGQPAAVRAGVALKNGIRSWIECVFAL
jgi:thioredoxin 1